MSAVDGDTQLRNTWAQAGRRDRITKTGDSKPGNKVKRALIALLTAFGGCEVPGIPAAPLPDAWFVVVGPDELDL